jgi:putative transposase
LGLAGSNPLSASIAHNIPIDRVTEDVDLAFSVAGWDDFLPLLQPSFVSEEPMRKSRFTDGKIVAILRESDCTSVAEAAKKHKVGDQTIYVWRKHFARLAPADVKRLKALELENAKLMHLLAERDLEVDLMREVNRESGEPTRASRPGPVPPGARTVATACLWAARRATPNRCRRGPPITSEPTTSCSTPAPTGNSSSA